jgi:hypothetical protein
LVLSEVLIGYFKLNSCIIGYIVPLALLTQSKQAGNMALALLMACFNTDYNWFGSE